MAWVMMAHHATSMSGMKDPAKGLGQVITGIEDTRDVIQNNVTICFPILNSKPLDSNVARVLSGLLGIDQLRASALSKTGMSLIETM